MCCSLQLYYALARSPLTESQQPFLLSFICIEQEQEPLK